MYIANCAAVYEMFVKLKDNFHANYLIGAWISSYDPCISQGWIFQLSFRSWKLDLATGKYGRWYTNMKDHNNLYYTTHAACT